ncbi:MAG: hypothetical protein EBZ61_08280 [Micrococcales bacterium]|nr:hypothetical protein [Micrococcales bacterium]
MTTSDWIALVTIIITILTSIAGLVRFLVKHYLSELRPNSGNSMRDKIDGLDEKIRGVESRVDEIYRLLLNKSLS